jgi:archaetidylinositol phosphate synthase
VAARRELTFLLAEPERRLLRAMATLLPRWVTSDGLTALGVVGAVGAGVAYALSTLSAAWLWAASALLVVNWFGDSLDGTLARVRRAERPRYGYYLDHMVDAFSTAAIGAGIGLSPYVNLGVALAGVIAYLILSINIYLESQAFGVFRLGYSRIGPTEARIVLISANAALALSGPSAAAVPIATGAVTALVVGMLVMVAVRIGRNLSQLARLEPPPPVPPPLPRYPTAAPRSPRLHHDKGRPSSGAHQATA